MQLNFTEAHDIYIERNKQIAALGAFSGKALLE